MPASKLHSSQLLCYASNPVSTGMGRH